jgi:hypothetical protein
VDDDLVQGDQRRSGEAVRTVHGQRYRDVIPST